MPTPLELVPEPLLEPVLELPRPPLLLVLLLAPLLALPASSSAPPLLLLVLEPLLLLVLLPLLLLVLLPLLLLVLLPPPPLESASSFSPFGVPTPVGPSHPVPAVHMTVGVQPLLEFVPLVTSLNAAMFV